MHFLDKRENAVLAEMAARQERSEKAVMRSALRIYQLVDKYQREGMTLGFLDDQGDFFDPFDHDLPKMAPVPYGDSELDPDAYETPNTTEAEDEAALNALQNFINEGGPDGQGNRS